ncbi:MAG: hypothetical protein MKZ94_13740 [Pirellulales bacterium]|nr:hypothetical protein [Pirellulales bacterium]
MKSVADTPSQSRLKRLLQLWFSLSIPVTRKQYIVTGFSLMLVKYLIEFITIYATTGNSYAIEVFLSPILKHRSEVLDSTTQFLPWILFVWTIPFLWISVSMSVRRSVASTGSSFLGLLILVPLLNFVTMLLLCILPNRASRSKIKNLPVATPIPSNRIRSAISGMFISIAGSLVLYALSVTVFKNYGILLFFGMPVLVGVITSYMFNRVEIQSTGQTVLVAEIGILLCSGALLVFAVEGIICIVMLLPLAAVIVIIGALIGRSMAANNASGGHVTTSILLLLPLLSGADLLENEAPVYEVISTVVIDAPPEEVWPNVIGFSELDAPPAWYFELGIAYPLRATIDGEGVGAIRHCEFSTGAFVEPITVWDKPNRLTFDVTKQPPPMNELSPYRHVHPPHLDGYLNCKQGEFRLIRLPDNRTLLEGSTWYEFKMYPQGYWTLWSDTSIHRIHQRVLQHIKKLSEK